MVRSLALVIVTCALVLMTSTARVSTQSASYGVTDLGTLGGASSTALAIQASGFPQSAGSALTATGVRHAAYGNPFLPLRDLGTLGGRESEATATNGGDVAGYAQVSSGAFHAFLWRFGRPMIDLGTLGGAQSWAYGINDEATVVGVSDLASGGRRAFIAPDGVMSQLSLGTVTESTAYDINNVGQVVGFLKSSSTAPARAFLWQNGTTTPLGSLGGASVATAINDRGVVVGHSVTASGTTHAFRWENGVMLDLGTLGGADSQALAVNDDGTVAGWSRNAQGAIRAVIWRGGQIFDLNDLIKPDSGWVLEAATGVGFQDALVGYGLHNGQTRAFLAVPPIDIEVSVNRHQNELDTNIPNPHETGPLTLGASVYNLGDFTATGVKIRDTITGPIEYVSWDGADCVKDGQTLTCTFAPFESFGRDVIIQTRTTGPGPITHTATLIRSDQVDENSGNNRATETNTAVSLASLTLAENMVTGGGSVLSRATLTSPAPIGGARVHLRSSHPDIASVPAEFDVQAFANGGLWREFYVTTRAVTAPTTVQISATYGLRTFTQSLTVMPAGASWPYGGTARALPGIIQAEDFDGGGQNVGYFDTGGGNDGDAYRDTDVDIEVTRDTGGGYNVGWMARTEWLQYTVNVATAGTYRLDLRVAANGTGGRLHVEFNGVDKTGAMNIPNTGGWQSWTTISAPVTLSAGTQRMRVFVDAAGPTGIVGNVNFIQLTSTSTGPGSTPFTGTPINLPGIVQAENFDNGGANVAYHDTTAGNTGGAYRPTTDVDIQATTDTNQGYNIGWLAAGEWLVYSVNVPTAGSYRLDLRVAASGAGGRLHVEFNGVDKTGAMTIPNTGGWQNWTTVSAPVTLSAGAQRMRVVVDAAGATGTVGNLNFIQVVSAGPPTTSQDIVIYASDVTALHGNWSKSTDAGSPGSVALKTPDVGYAVLDSPLAAPVHYFDVPFTPIANTPYTIWLRLKALGNSKYNDAVWVQFSGAQAGGSPVYAINSTSGLVVNLATDATATSLNNWGWANGAYWLTQPRTVTFPSGGAQTLRVQVREDGVMVDQIVLSPKTYLTTPPGGRTNDSTIVAKH